MKLLFQSLGFVAAACGAALVTIILCQAIELNWARRSLACAASAAAIEAGLPRATAESITAAAARKLPSSLMEVTQSLAVSHAADRLEIYLSVEATDVIPDWLEPLGLSLAGRKLTATKTVAQP